MTSGNLLSMQDVCVFRAQTMLVFWQDKPLSGSSLAGSVSSCVPQPSCGYAHPNVLTSPILW